MDAVEYLNHRARICKKHHCGVCPLRKYDNIGVTGCQADYSCIVLELEEPDRSIEIVENWAKENPVKTYLSVLLEKLPDVKVTNNDGIPFTCLNVLFGGDEYCLKNNITCVECWNREYKEEEE